MKNWIPFWTTKLNHFLTETQIQIDANEKDQWSLSFATQMDVDEEY